jgi:hypothetical protein
MSAVEDEAPKKRTKNYGTPKVQDKDEETIKKLKVGLSLKNQLIGLMSLFSHL